MRGGRNALCVRGSSVYRLAVLSVSDSASRRSSEAPTCTNCGTSTVTVSDVSKVPRYSVHRHIVSFSTPIYSSPNNYDNQHLLPARWWNAIGSVLHTISVRKWLLAYKPSLPRIQEIGPFCNHPVVLTNQYLADDNPTALCRMRVRFDARNRGLSAIQS